jgi:DNA modification methylase
MTGTGAEYSDGGGASRFFYTAKASRSERESGLDAVPASVTNTDTPPGTKGSNSPRAGANRSSAARNHHPTVKPLDLMQWLCRLITPKAGLVLDPFCGSGSTGRAAVAEGFSFIGIELDPEYAAIARARIADYAPLFHDPEAA